MKKFLGIFFVMLSLLATGYAAPKDEATALHEKYYGEKGAFTILWNESRQQPEFTLGTQEFYNQMSDEIKQWKAIEQQLESEKISNEVAPLKNAMLAQSSDLIKFYNLLLSVCEEMLDKKETPELTKKFLDSLGTFNDELQQKKYERLNEYQKLTEGAPLPVASVNGKNYRAYTSSNVLLAVTDSQTRQEIGNNSSNRKEALGKFVIVSVFVKNNQKNSVTIDSSSFRLIDNQQREFISSSPAQFEMQEKSKTNKKFSTKLTSGMSTELKLVFDVPKNMQLNDFTLQGTGGFSKNNIVMDIQPWRIKTVKN